MPLQIFVLRVAACFAKIQNIMVPASITIEGWTHLFASMFCLSFFSSSLSEKQKAEVGQRKRDFKKEKGREKEKEGNKLND